MALDYDVYLLPVSVDESFWTLQSSNSFVRVGLDTYIRILKDIDNTFVQCIHEYDGDTDFHRLSSPTRY